MKKRKIVIVMIVAIIITLGYSYHRFKCNEIEDTYNFITLRNIYLTLNDFINTFEEQYNNQNVDEDEIMKNKILKEYLMQMSTYERYLSLSPRLSSIRLDIDRIADVDDEGITKQELEYLINVRNKLKTYLDKINDELYEVSIRRMFGIFRKSNIDDLEAIFKVM